MSRAPEAAARKRSTAERLFRTVERRGGLVLSPAYVNSQSSLRYRCREGHEWQAKPNCLLQGTWCPVCARKDQKHLALAKRRVARRLERIVETRRGTLLSDYLGSKAAVLVRCDRGHIWKTTVGSLDDGVWCPDCKARSALDRLRAIAEARGGACLARHFRRGRDPLPWRCARGHEGVTPANNVRRGGWCPKCAHSVRGTLDGMRALAIERGGRCLSRTWNNHRDPLRFECRRGHRFEAHARLLKTGLWCPACSPRGPAATGP